MVLARRITESELEELEHFTDDIDEFTDALRELLDDNGEDGRSIANMILSEGRITRRIQNEMEDVGIPANWSSVYARNLAEFYASKGKKNDAKKQESLKNSIMLDDIQWEETSGVDYPANNEEGWLVIKNKHGLSKAESESLQSHIGLAVGLSAVDGRSLPGDAGEAVKTLEGYLRNQGFKKSFLANLFGGGLQREMLQWIMGRLKDDDDKEGDDRKGKPESNRRRRQSRRPSGRTVRIDDEYGRLTSREREDFRDRVLDTRGITSRQRADLQDRFDDEDRRGRSGRGRFSRATNPWSKRNNGDWVRQEDTNAGTIRARIANSSGRKYVLHTEAPDGKGAYNTDKQSYPTMRNAKAAGDDFVERNKHRLAQINSRKQKPRKFTANSY